MGLMNLGCCVTRAADNGKDVEEIERTVTTIPVPQKMPAMPPVTAPARAPEEEPVPA